MRRLRVGGFSRTRNTRALSWRLCLAALAVASGCSGEAHVGSSEGGGGAGSTVPTGGSIGDPIAGTTSSGPYPGTGGSAPQTPCNAYCSARTGYCGADASACASSCAEAEMATFCDEELEAYLSCHAEAVHENGACVPPEPCAMELREYSSCEYPCTKSCGTHGNGESCDCCLYCEDFTVAGPR